LLFAAAVLASAAGASPADSKPGRDDLVTLYLLSVAADRCGFPLTARQADALDRETRALAEKLKLRPRENDALYSEADVTFERQGRAACDRSGQFAKGFRQTLQRMIGP
jgi:hypothetical protein